MPLRKSRREDTLEFNETLTINNLFLISKTFKKNKDKLRKRLKTRGDLSSVKDTRKINKENYFKKYDKDNKTYYKGINDIKENFVKNEETKRKLFLYRKKGVPNTKLVKKMEIIIKFQKCYYCCCK